MGERAGLNSLIPNLKFQPRVTPPEVEIPSLLRAMGHTRAGFAKGWMWETRQSFYWRRLRRRPTRAAGARLSPRAGPPRDREMFPHPPSVSKPSNMPPRKAKRRVGRMRPRRWLNLWATSLTLIFHPRHPPFQRWPARCASWTTRAGAGRKDSPRRLQDTKKKDSPQRARRARRRMQFSGFLSVISVVNPSPNSSLKIQFSRRRFA